MSAHVRLSHKMLSLNDLYRLNCWWCDSKDSSMNNPQILHSQEVHPLHVARDMSLASTNIEVAVDLILERCEATATIEMPERIAHGSFAFIRKIK